MRSGYLFLLSVSFVALSSSQAFAQANNAAGNDEIEGYYIRSNDDDTNGEYFRVYESSDMVIDVDGKSYTHIANQNDVSINYDSDGSGVGTFAINRNGTGVMTFNNAGNATFANSMTTNGINNGSDGITNAGAISGVTTLAASGAASVVGVNNNNGGITNAGAVSGVTTLDVSGLATLNGGATVNSTFSVDSNGATAAGSTFVVNNTAISSTSSNAQSSVVVNDTNVTITHNNGVNNNNIVVGSTQAGAIGANSFNYGTTVNGGMLIEGDLGVNGSIYALNPTANTGINVANNGLAINGASNTATLLADSNSTAGDGRGQITLQEDKASFLVYNQQNGNAHGMVVEQTQTVLSGGTRTTSLTLNDDGATFHNTISGGPARVTGVADGRSDFDAVNFRQLRKANAGVASVAAMANIPQPAPGKQFAVGIGYGNYESEDAYAVGAAANITENVSFKTSFGRSNETNVIGAGFGFSW